MDDFAYLIKEEATGTDADGNEIIRKTTRGVFCKVRSITSAEFYEAATDNLKPEAVLTISHSIDYEDEKLVKWRGEYYDVLRTYWAGDAVELTLTKTIGITEGTEESE